MNSVQIEEIIARLPPDEACFIGALVTDYLALAALCERLIRWTRGDPRHLTENLYVIAREMEREIGTTA